MSATKHRSWSRGLDILRRAASHPDGVLYFHCEGGMAVANPDVQRLIRDGFLTRPGRPSPPKWSAEWSHLFRDRPHLHGHAFRTMSRITTKGSIALQADHRANEAIANGLAARALDAAYRVRKLRRKLGH